MFSKAKRFEIPSTAKNQSKSEIKMDKHRQEIEKQKTNINSTSKLKQMPYETPTKFKTNTQSACSSVSSVKSFITPQRVKNSAIYKSKSTSSTNNILLNSNKEIKKKTDKTQSSTDFIKVQQVEIRNKDHTISEYTKQIEELKTELANLQRKLNDNIKNRDKLDDLQKQFVQITISDKDKETINTEIHHENSDMANTNYFKAKIIKLEKQCDKLELELSSKQVELSSLEEIITIRDSLCKDLQNKLTYMESCLEETKQRLEMVKGHHALALEANESIRREYKAELESLKIKMEEEKQTIINKSKIEQEYIKATYNTSIKSMKEELAKDKDAIICDLQKKMLTKENEMKAKLEQVEEAAHEKLRLCEIQFEERSKSIQKHWLEQDSQIQSLENEIKDLKHNLNLSEDQNKIMHVKFINLQNERDVLKTDKLRLINEIEELKEDSKKKIIEYENKINKLTVDVEKTINEKNKFEMSLSVTRDIVQVLTMRLRESDNELETLENKVQSLANCNEVLESEIVTYKTTLNNTVLECNEYKEALVNILKSKAALAKEHTRIMEHNVTLIESLQNVEKEAYREFGAIKSELIEDVELLKKESYSQIQLLREEVEKKHMLCDLATEHAGQATAAAEQSRILLAQASTEISRLETENNCLKQQIQDQQSLVVELSLLRQENEELTMTLAKKSSLVDTMKKEIEQIQSKPKSPLVNRKNLKIGKENVQNVIISPLRERNH